MPPARGFVRRIADATPADRDRGVDALRALAILGVVLGHWLVTAVVADSGTLRVTSPLKQLPELTPLTWLLQTLAVFFLVAGRVSTQGYVRARAAGGTYTQWLGPRLARLSRPVVVVAAVWAVAAVAMLAAGADQDTVWALVKLVWSPLWFLLVLALLTALTPLAARLSPWWPLAAVALSDLVRYGLNDPAPGWDGVAGWVEGVNVVCGWLVPYCLGAAWAQGRPRGRAAGWGLLAGGAVVAAGLVGWGGYPAAMVGVPGAAVSNLDPPSLAAVAFGLAQCGAATLLAGPLRRALRRPRLWAGVALVNLGAMTIFLWHQTAMIAVTAVALKSGTAVTGLHTVPDGFGWVAWRVAWLPAFAAALAVCVLAFHAYERRRPPRRRRTRPG
ncbi:acyltransferase family protein [Nonomuraea ceibae]|uniref:acyltransferase family protein n=1 Tax=Nonomuraea ceibae TaxID=1935170 RepID=UPI0027E17714|nr:acyltransferase family protein [Nonomuraea ceibae]